MPQFLTGEVLHRVMPNANPERVAGFVQPLNIALVAFDITTTKRIAAFLAQIAVESGELKYTRELWGPTPQQMKYERPHPKAIELGNVQAGDGLRFRGRGLIQLTGRSNYLNCGKSLGIDLIAYPEVLEQYLLASLSAGWFWNSRGISAAADAMDFSRVTKLVNGGLTAYAERLGYYGRAKAVYSL